MNSLIIIFLLLASIKSDSSGNLVLDFTLTYEQLITKLNIGYGEKNITSYFQIDISSSNSWILNSVLNETYSSSFTNKGQKKDLERDNLNISGEIATDIFHFGGLLFNEDERLSFITVHSLKGEPSNIGGLGFGKNIEKIYSPSFIMNNKLNKDGGKYVLEITKDPTSEYSIGHIVVGDNLNENPLIPSIEVALDNENQNFKSSWVTKVEKVFFGNVLREKNDAGEYVINVNKYPYFGEGMSATFETIYNKIYVPYDISQDFFYKMDKEYFLFNGKHKCVVITDNDVMKYKCPLDDVKKLGQLHFILSENLDIYLDEFDLFTCDNTSCNSTIEANPNIKDHWVLGIPVLRKFTCLFEPAEDDSKKPKMTLYSLRNKAKVVIQGKPSNPPTYLSTTFVKGGETIHFPILMGTNMEQAYFAIDINGYVSFVSKDVYDTYNASQKFEPIGDSHTFDYGEFQIEGFLFKDQFTLANISTTEGHIVLGSKFSGGHKYEQFRGAISASKRDHSFLTAILNSYGVNKGEPGFLLQYDDTPDDEHMGDFMIGDFSTFIEENSKYVTQLTLTDNKLEWEAEIDYIFFKDYLEEKNENSVYKINLANPHYSKKTKVVFETVYSNIIVPFNDKELFKKYLTKYYFKVDDENLCTQDFKNDSWNIVCSIEEYHALGQIHFLLDTRIGLSDGYLDIFLDNNDLFTCGENECAFGITIDPYITDRFVFGNNVLKQFKTFFGLKKNEEKILFIGDYNKALVMTVGVPTEENEKKYVEGDFEIGKNGLMYTTLSIGTPFQKISTILDLSGVHTWVHDTLYNQEKSTTKMKKNSGQIEFENFLVSGDFYHDTTNFASTTIKEFDFQVVTTTDLSELPYEAAIGLGRTTYINTEHQDLSYSFVKRVYESLNINSATDKFMIKFNSNIEKENTGKIYIGDFDDLIDLDENVDELAMDPNAPLGKWSSNHSLVVIYFRNILTEKKDGGSYSVNQDILHTDLDYVPVYFESRINKIYIPYKYSTLIFNDLTSKYFTVNGETICQKKENEGKHIGYFCSKDEIKRLDQMHFIFSNNFDIYLEREDLFKCVENRCDFLIESNEKYDNAFYFGMPVLKQFTTVFKREGNSAKILFKGKYNKAKVQFYENPKKDVNPNYEVTPFEIDNNGIIQMKGKIGQVDVKFAIDINGKKSWIEESKFNCDMSPKSNCQTLEDDSFEQDNFKISGKKVKDSFQFQTVIIDLELISANKHESTNLTGALSLSKKSNIIPQFLEKLSQKIEITNNSYFLRFGGEGPNGENIGTLYYGNLNAFITENQLKTLPIQCDTEYNDKWSTRLKAIYFKNYLSNNTNGVYLVSNETYRSYIKNVGVVFETIYNAIYFPYKYKDELFARLKDLYFQVENENLTLKCNLNEGEIEYFVCKKDIIKSLGQIHFLIKDDISLYLDANDLFKCTNDECVFLIQANKKFNDYLVFGLPMLKKFDFVFNYESNSILLLSDSNKATLKIVGEVKDDSGSDSIKKIILSVFQVILLIIIILLALAVIGIGVIYFFKTKNASKVNATVDQGPMQNLTMNEQQ